MTEEYCCDNCGVFSEKNEWSKNEEVAFYKLTLTRNDPDKADFLTNNDFLPLHFCSETCVIDYIENRGATGKRRKKKIK